MKTKATPFQITATISSVLLVLLSLVFFLLRWPGLPAQIPSHYNELGEPDAWTAKYLPALLLGIQLLCWLLLTLLSRFPKLWHLPVEVSDSSKPVLFSVTRTLILDMQLLLILGFGYLIISICSSAALRVSVLIPIVLCVIGSMVYYFIRITKIALNDARRLLREEESEK